MTPEYFCKLHSVYSVKQICEHTLKQKKRNRKEDGGKGDKKKIGGQIREVEKKIQRKKFVNNVSSPGYSLILYVSAASHCYYI